MFKNPLENEKVPVGEHTPVRYFQSLSTYLIHNVAFISFHIRDNRLSNDHRFILSVTTVTMVNLGKGNKRRARGSGAGGSRVHHRAVTQTPLPSEAASSLSHHSHTQPVHLILLWRLAVRLCVCCAFTGQCSSTAPGWKCVFRGKAAFRQRDSEHNTPHSLDICNFQQKRVPFWERVRFETQIYGKTYASQRGEEPWEIWQRPVRAQTHHFAISFRS